MPYALLADAVLLLHFVFVLFVVGGGLLALKWPKVVWLHLPAAFWGVWIELSGSICPLTPLEQSLLTSAGESSYAGSFIGHYLEPVLYPVGLTKDMQWWLGLIAVAINVLVYRQVLKAWKERQDKTQL